MSDQVMVGIGVRDETEIRAVILQGRPRVESHAVTAGHAATDPNFVRRIDENGRAIRSLDCDWHSRRGIEPSASGDRAAWVCDNDLASGNLKEIVQITTGDQTAFQ